MRQRQIVVLGLTSLVALVATAALVVWPVEADTKDMPEKITIVVPFADGGAVAEYAEVTAALMSDRLGVLVETKVLSGMGGLIGSKAVAQAEPNGETLLMAASTSIILAAMYQDMNLSLQDDFDTIGQAGPLEFALAVAADSPYETAQDLLDDISHRPGVMRWAHAGRGSSSHVIGRVLLDRFNLHVSDLPYGGGSIIRNAVIGNHVDFAVLGIQQMADGGGELRTLAVTGRERSALFPEYPTLLEAGVGVGLPGSPVALYAPRNTRPELLELLRRVFKDSMLDPAASEALYASGLEVKYAPHAEIDATMDAQIELAEPVIRTLQADR